MCPFSGHISCWMFGWDAIWPPALNLPRPTLGHIHSIHRAADLPCPCLSCSRFAWQQPVTRSMRCPCGVHAALALAVLWTSGAARAANGTIPLTLIHVNDVHARFVPSSRPPPLPLRRQLPCTTTHSCMPLPTAVLLDSCTHPPFVGTILLTPTLPPAITPRRLPALGASRGWRRPSATPSRLLLLRGATLWCCMRVRLRCAGAG